jgi:formyl-CoA transferase
MQTGVVLGYDSASMALNLKVIELGQLIAGPFCGKILAEFGAEVIKIEPPPAEGDKGGDPLRTWRKLHEGTSLWWYLQARNKKSVTVNLRASEGQEIVRKLAADADILIENFRPGTMEKWGLGYERLSAANPKLVMVRLSGFGQNGPSSGQAGFGAIGEALGGIRYVTGYADRPPVRVGVSLGDAIAAMYGAIGALVAVQQRAANGGKGQIVDVALTEAVFSLMESMLPEFGMSGFVRERSGASLPGIVPSNTYTTRDGAHVVIGANGDSIFKRFMSAIGREDLANDPALATNDGRVEHTEELDNVIGAWAASHDLPHVMEVLNGAQVPAGKIYSIADIVQDAQFQARGMIEKHALAGGGEVLLPGVVPKLSATPGGTRWIGPKLGEHTEEVLMRIGYDNAAQQRLREQGVI